MRDIISQKVDLFFFLLCRTRAEAIKKDKDTCANSIKVFEWLAQWSTARAESPRIDNKPAGTILFFGKKFIAFHAKTEHPRINYLQSLQCLIYDTILIYIENKKFNCKKLLLILINYVILNKYPNQI